MHDFEIWEPTCLVLEFRRCRGVSDALHGVVIGPTRLWIIKWSRTRRAVSARQYLCSLDVVFNLFFFFLGGGLEIFGMHFLGLYRV